MPFNTQRWTWTPDSAGTPTQHCANQASCTITPQTSGTMTLTALVNGAEKSRSVHIRALCAPTGDALMDSLPILDALGAAWDSSNADDPNAANRRKRYFAVECNASGECGWTVYPNGPFDTPCEATPPTRDTTGTRTAGGHIHPFTPFTGSPLPPSEIFPPNCGRGPGRGGAPRPSPSDLTHIVGPGGGLRSEEHTSELQSRENLVCRLLLEKKNTQ